MAKKKEPCVADAVTLFKDAMLRASLTDYLYVNRVLYSKSTKDVVVLINVDLTLWDALMGDEEFKKHATPLDITNPEHQKLQEKFFYGEDINSEGWVEINSDVMYAGEMIHISIDGFKYNIPVNKALFPIRFKKAEYNNFGYKIYINPRLALSLKKKFDGLVPDTAFTVVRAFQVI